MNKFFEILYHIDPSMYRSNTYKEALEREDSDTDQVLLGYAIEIIKIQHDEIEQLKTKLKEEVDSLWKALKKS